MAVIIEIGSKQHKVEEGSVIKVDLMSANPGDKVELGNVMAVLGAGPAVFGKPYVEGAKVDATIVRHGKDKKIDVFTYKSKKRIRKLIGHRQDFTELKIEKIITG